METKVTEHLQRAGQAVFIHAHEIHPLILAYGVIGEGAFVGTLGKWHGKNWVSLGWHDESALSQARKAAYLSFIKRTAIVCSKKAHVVIIVVLAAAISSERDICLFFV